MLDVVVAGTVVTVVVRKLFEIVVAGAVLFSPRLQNALNIISVCRELF